MNPYRLCLLLPLALLAGGCINSAPPDAPAAALSEAPFTMRRALNAARSNLLEIQTYEALQQLAAEHSENRMRLQLTGVAADLRSGNLAEMMVNRYIDNALSYNHLVGATVAEDLVPVQRVRTGQLLDCATASALARFEAEYQLSRLGATHTDALREQELEVRTLTGASPLQIARFDPTGLPQPHSFAQELPALQQFAAFTRPESRGASFSPNLPGEVKKLFQNDQAIALTFAEQLYRIPRRLEMARQLDPKIDWTRIARLANAIGIAFQVERDWNRLNSAYAAYRLLELKKQLSSEADSELEQALIRTRLAWQLAYFRLRTDLGMSDFDVPLPELPKLRRPELTEESAILFEMLSKLVPGSSSRP